MMSCNNSKQGIGIKMENLDTSAVPGDDFFQFADGGWNAAHPLTDEYARFGSFDHPTSPKILPPQMAAMI